MIEDDGDDLRRENIEVRVRLVETLAIGGRCLLYRKYAFTLGGFW